MSSWSSPRRSGPSSAAARGGGGNRLQQAAERTLSVEDALTLLRHKGFDPSEYSELVNAAANEEGVIDVPGLLESSEETVLTKVLADDLVISDWNSFTADIQDIYEHVASLPNSGKNADYIPILAEQDENAFTVAVCTVDGQKFSYGNTDSTHCFSIQAGIKPWIYAAAVEQHGLKKVHRHTGIEPSGLAFNEVSLNASKRPHNPMINAGAIATGSLVRPDLDMAGRFRFFRKLLTDVVGGEKIGFSQPTYLCEQETAWRNNALMYYMDSAGIFPEDADPRQALDFYFQMCSIEVNPQMAANAAATLATGGISPLTGKRCFSPSTAKSCLTLMFSCGMNDYSGEWCTKIGLPAKSGVGGIVYVVIPHVMGIAVYSPPVDAHGNSVRAVEFFKRLLSEHRLGIFDQVVSGMQSMDIRQSMKQSRPTRSRSLFGEIPSNSDRKPMCHSTKRSSTDEANPRSPLCLDRNCLSQLNDSGSSPVDRYERQKGFVGKTSAVDEACASGMILERWKNVLRRMGRLKRNLHMIREWCRHTFRADIDWFACENRINRRPRLRGMVSAAATSCHIGDGRRPTVMEKHAA
eukprot:gb/GECG01012629.1/.p1 GENE.gb/GECG01012629.1/~~gb/GECG01012629.1/.p1  ORF type:complete len:579 (+),score=63.97 gb/GECG01012629.1/:1-1737(+)